MIERAAAIGMTGKVASRVEDIRDRGFGPDPAFAALAQDAAGVA